MIDLNEGLSAYRLGVSTTITFIEYILIYMSLY